MKKVLVIEDCAEYRQLWKEFFEKVGSHLNATAEVVEKFQSPEKLGLKIMETIISGGFVITDNDLGSYGFHKKGKELYDSICKLGLYKKVVLSSLDDTERMINIGKGYLNRKMFIKVGMFLEENIVEWKNDLIKSYDLYNGRGNRLGINTEVTDKMKEDFARLKSLSDEIFGGD